jgi:D-apionolactonase
VSICGEILLVTKQSRKAVLMKTLTPYEIWYGRNSPPPEQVRLKSGDLDLLYQAGDLRYIRFAGVELIRRIYVAIRDHNWNTIPGVMSDLAIRAEKDSFSISFTARHQSGDLDFSWQAHITGDAQGKISYSMEGTANTAFHFNRIGFCVLHPIDGIAGHPYQAETPAGSIKGTLPVLIGPQRVENGFEVPLFPSCSSLSVNLDDHTAIHTRFEGDLFEMEDQRNWTDGSFKTYCTPLSLGYPHTATAGQRIYQKVTLWLEQTERSAKVAPAEEPIRLYPAQSSRLPLPKIGFGMPSEPVTAAPREIELLSGLKPAHLKQEVHFKHPDWASQLDLALRTVGQLGTGLELAVFLNEDAENQLDRLKERLAGAQVSRFIIFNEADAHLFVTAGKWITLAHAHLNGAFPGVPICGGTNGNFAQLNQAPPDVTGMDGISYPINSQVHSSDEASLVEALQGHTDTATSARALSRGLPVCVSSVTMKPPFNQTASEEEAPPPPGELPAPVDPRQMALFCAAWTLGSLSALTRGGAAAVTYYETLGWRGLIETNSASPLPEKFLSQPGMVFPVYHVFADLAAAGPAQCTPIETNRPLAVTGLSLDSGTGRIYVLANLTPETQFVTLESLIPGNASLRRLNDQSAVAAMFDTTHFRSSSEPISIEGTTLSLTLLPYEYVHLEI